MSKQDRAQIIGWMVIGISGLVASIVIAVAYVL